MDPDDIKEVDQDDGTHFIKVSLYDTKFTSTILKTAMDTVTSYLVEAIVNKVEITVDDQKFYKLVLVVMSLSNCTKQVSRYCIRTLRQNEIVLDVESQLTRRQTLKHPFHTSSSRWFFKDIRSSPLDLGIAADLSCDESSDEDDEISHNDLSCISQTHRRGYMLKRSSKDPNVWMQRYCVLTDKLWCVNDNLRVPRASCIPLNSSTVLQNKCSTLNCHGAIILQSNQGTNCFLASSTDEQEGWISDLALQATLTADNDVIGMAEMIICDEERTRYERMQRGITPFLYSDAVAEYLDPLHAIRKLSYTAMNCNTSEDGNYHEPSSILLLEHRNHLNLPRNISARQTLPRPSIRDLRIEDDYVFEALTFIKSVHSYMELFRHDLGIPVEAQWRAVLLICRDCLLIPFSRVRHHKETEVSQYSEGLISCAMFDSENKNNDTDNLGFTTRTSYWNKVSTDVILRLNHSVYSQVRKCDRNATVPSVPKCVAVDNKVFPRTPSAGGEDSSMRMLFGEGVSSSSLSLSHAALGATSSSLWSWTSRALGIAGNMAEESDEIVSSVSDCVNLVGVDCEGNRRISSSGRASPQRVVFKENSEVIAGSTKDSGLYIVLSMASSETDSIGSQETYYLKDRYIRPDSSIFDELKEELRHAMESLT